MQRERLGSRLGFILLSAGCAIGVGNVWKFPWMVGQYGGGAFVVCYVLFLLILGLPIMTMEFAIGRASQKSPVRAYQALEKPGSKWHIHGYLAMIGNYLLMMFYTTVCGWMLYYFYLTVSGRFVGATGEQVQAAFPEMLGKPVVMTVCMVAVVVIGFMINSFGLQGGLERVTKVMMIILLAIMVVLAINSIMTEGSGEGLRFYLIPDLGRMQECGIANVIVAAMNQAFFTLSLGIGAMAIFGSYIGKGRALLGEAVNVAILDTFVAFTAGLIIFPACFAFGVAPDSGPNLIFVTLPNIFNHMALGAIGQPVLRIHGVCTAFSTVSLCSRTSCPLHGPDRLEPQKDRSHQHRADDPAVAAVRARLQCLVRLPAVRRRLERARPSRTSSCPTSGCRSVRWFTCCSAPPATVGAGRTSRKRPTKAADSRSRIISASM